MERSASIMRLFAPGERLGWAFRDRFTLVRDFGERRPAPPLIHLEPLDRLDRAETGLPGRVTQAIILGLAGSAVVVAAGLAVSIVDIRVLAAAGAIPTLVAVLVAWILLRRRRVAAEALDVHRIAVKDAYVDEVTAWQRRRDAFVSRELAAVGPLDEWGAVPVPPGVPRFDVFGGTLSGWEGLLTVFGSSLLSAPRPVTVVDLSREEVSAELAALAAWRGLAVEAFVLPADLPRCDLLAGMAPDEIVDVLVESMYPGGRPDDRAARSTDRLLLGAVCHALGGHVTIGRLVAGIQVLMREPGDASALHPAERDRIADELFSDDYRRDALPSLRRLQSFLHPLRALGAASAAGATSTPGVASAAGAAGAQDTAGAQGSPAPPLLRLALSAGGRTAGSELLTDLLVHWLVDRVIRGAQPAGSTLIVVGADDLPPAHLSRLADACERRSVRMVNLFRRLREGSLLALGSGTAGFMRLGHHEEAAAAADFIGREHRFVVTQVTRTLSGGTSHSHGDSYARDWTRTFQHADQTGWSDASSRQRVYEYTVEPRSLQGLPDHALLLVSHTLHGVELTGVECNPEIVLLPRVSMRPLPAPPAPLPPAPLPPARAGAVEGGAIEAGRPYRFPARQRSAAHDYESPRPQP